LGKAGAFSCFHEAHPLLVPTSSSALLLAAGLVVVPADEEEQDEIWGAQHNQEAEAIALL